MEEVAMGKYLHDTVQMQFNSISFIDANNGLPSDYSTLVGDSGLNFNDH